METLIVAPASDIRHRGSADKQNNVDQKSTVHIHFSFWQVNSLIPVQPSLLLHLVAPAQSALSRLVTLIHISFCKKTPKEIDLQGIAGFSIWNSKFLSSYISSDLYHLLNHSFIHWGVQLTSTTTLFNSIKATLFPRHCHFP